MTTDQYHMVVGFGQLMAGLDALRDEADERFPTLVSKVDDLIGYCAKIRDVLPSLVITTEVASETDPNDA